MYSSRNTDTGPGWLRLRVGHPGLLALRRLGPRRGGGVAAAMDDIGRLPDVQAARGTPESADERKLLGRTGRTPNAD